MGTSNEGGVGGGKAGGSDPRFDEHLAKFDEYLAKIESTILRGCMFLLLWALKRFYLLLFAMIPGVAVGFLATLGTGWRIVCILFGLLLGSLCGRAAYKAYKGGNRKKSKWLLLAAVSGCTILLTGVFPSSFFPEAQVVGRAQRYVREHISPTTARFSEADWTSEGDAYVVWGRFDVSIRPHNFYTYLVKMDREWRLLAITIFEW
jgi:hypothetical protein